MGEPHEPIHIDFAGCTVNTDECDVMLAALISDDGSDQWEWMRTAEGYETRCTARTTEVPVTLSDLVADLGPVDRSARYELVISPEPEKHRDALGDPAAFTDAVALSGRRLAALSDSIDHIYAASHEIAEDLTGWQGHTDDMWMTQANILAHWCKLLATRNPATNYEPVSDG